MQLASDRDAAELSVMHVISGLNLGGAETMLYKLLLASRQSGTPVRHSVVSLSASGPMAEKMEAIGTPVYQLGLSKNPFSVLRGLIRLWRLSRQHKTHVVQGWMYHGSLIATLLCVLRRRVALFWNIRHSLHSLENEKRLTLWVIRVLARLSRAPVGIIYNSAVSAGQHEALGYDKTRRVVLPNGFDTSLFSPSPSAYSALRKTLGLRPETPLVGVIARYHPIKGHSNFIKAAGIVARHHPGIHFVCAGTNVDGDNPELLTLRAEAGLSETMHLVGECSDVPGLMAGLDILCSPSASEGFPNVIGEAMSCGVPCVATDVGASRDVIAGLGYVVPPDDPDALATGLLSALETETSRREELKRKCRAHIVENYGLDSVLGQYMECYRNAASSFLDPKTPSDRV